MDKVEKFQLYEKHGVLEYWLVYPKFESVEQWVLKNGVYHLEGAHIGKGTLTSENIPCISIDVSGIFKGLDKS